MLAIISRKKSIKQARSSVVEKQISFFILEKLKMEFVSYDHQGFPPNIYTVYDG